MTGVENRAILLPIAAAVVAGGLGIYKKRRTILETIGHLGQMRERQILLKNPFRKDDPLLKFIMEKYKLNLLSVPREKASLGDVYTREGNNKRLPPPSHISSFLEPHFEMPITTVDETFGNGISGITSNRIDATIGLEFLEGFLNVLWIGNLGTKIRAYFEKEGAKKISFNFADATRDSVDPETLRIQLNRYHIKEVSDLSEEGRRYYIVTGLAKSPSVSITAEGTNQKKLGLNTQEAGLSNLSSDVTIQVAEQSKVIFSDKRRLVFGVELFELEYKSISKRFGMKMVEEVIELRRGEKKLKKELEPAFIGDPKEGDAFFEIAET